MSANNSASYKYRDASDHVSLSLCRWFLLGGAEGHKKTGTHAAFINWVIIAVCYTVADGVRQMSPVRQNSELIHKYASVG
jgi:hypothetical protein